MHGHINRSRVMRAVPADHGPFVVSRLCPVCEGKSNLPEQACTTCYGTGVGRFFHGTKARLSVGELIKPGYHANFGDLERTTSFVYFTGTLDAAIWGAELALGETSGRIYIVEPTGPLEDDPNLTDQRFPGNPTKSFRSRDPVRVIGEVTDWKGHTPESLQAMKDGIERLAREGKEPIDD
jgi:hypothetical protein